MKKILILIYIFCFVVAGFGAFPTNTNYKTVDARIPASDFRDYTFYWNEWEDQIVRFTITYSTTPYDLSGYYCRFRVARNIEGTQTNDLDIASSKITIATSNVTFTVAKTNVPAEGTYWSELILMDSSTSNVVRTLGRGKLIVTESLFGN